MCYSDNIFNLIFDVYHLLGFPGSSAGKESICNTGDPSSNPGSGRSPGEGIGYLCQFSWTSLVAPDAMLETSDLRGKIPWEVPGNPPQYSCLENPQGQRSLVGYSSRDYKEFSWLNTAQQHLFNIIHRLNNSSNITVIVD